MVLDQRLGGCLFREGRDDLENNHGRRGILKADMKDLAAEGHDQYQERPPPTPSLQSYLSTDSEFVRHGESDDLTAHMHAIRNFSW